MTTLAKLPAQLVREGAIQAGVCVRPIVRELVDTETGESQYWSPIPCESTLASACPPCADKARRLRMQQCREGWHLDDRTRHATTPTTATGPTGRTTPTRTTSDGDDEPTRIRSTRRRDDVPDLPRLPVEDRTVGPDLHRPQTGKNGGRRCSSPSPCPPTAAVRPDGTPVDPASYDYRRAALDALHFPKLLDRFLQNLRRSAGYEVQYFAAVEPQRRLAPHLHAAIRGAIPRHCSGRSSPPPTPQVWWPPHDRHRLRRRPDPGLGQHASAATSTPTPASPAHLGRRRSTTSTPDEDAEPAHVVRFGRQSRHARHHRRHPTADRRVGYLTKYLTKSIADPLDDDDDDRRRRARRTSTGCTHELRWLPCSPECANWLAYGIQPKDATRGMVARRVPVQGPRPRTPRLRRPPRPGLPPVDRQDPHRAQGRPPSGSARRPRSRRHRPRRRRPLRRHVLHATANPATSGRPSTATTCPPTPPSSPQSIAERNRWRHRVRASQTTRWTTAP